MATVKVQLGDAEYRLVVDEEEGELADYGETAVVDVGQDHYLCLVEDPDAQEVEVQVKRGAAGFVKVDGVEMEEVTFDGSDEDEDEFEEEYGDEDEDEDAGEDLEEEEDEDEEDDDGGPLIELDQEPEEETEDQPV